MAAKILTQGSAAHRLWQVAGYGIVVLLFLWVVYGAQDYMVTKFSIGIAYALAILGLNVVTGWSGQVSLGHSAFFGVGAYTTAILMVDHGWSFYWTLPIAAALGFVVGGLVGLPALRIRGLYLALVTLAIAIAFPTMVKKFAGLTGGSNGKTISAAWNAPSWVPGNVTGNDWVFVTVALIAAVMFLLVSNLTRSRVGRGLIALRDNEIGAAVSGVYPAGFKTMAFACSASIGAVAGSLYALVVGTLSPDAFGLIRSIEFIAGLIVGGVATVTGALVGGLIIEMLPYYSSEWVNSIGFLKGKPVANVLLGTVLILITFVAPGGIVWLVRQMRARFVVFLPRVPSITSVRPSGRGEPAPSDPVAAASVSRTQGGDA